MSKPPPSGPSCAEAGIEACRDEKLDRERKKAAGFARYNSDVLTGSFGWIRLAVQVDDLDETFDRLRVAGVLATSTVPIVNGPHRSYFTRPETSNG
jgi:hypothetical protein